MRLVRLAAALAVAALFVPAAPALAAGDPTMPLWQVSAGMRRTGYSVVQGTPISSLNVAVLDVAGGEGQFPCREDCVEKGDVRADPGGLDVSPQLPVDARREMA